MPRFRNLAKHPIEDVPPGGEGFLAHVPFAQNYARLGLIEILDPDTHAPLAPPSPEAMAAMAHERDNALHHLEIARADAARAVERAVAAQRLELDKANARIADLEEMLASATQPSAPAAPAAPSDAAPDAPKGGAKGKGAAAGA